jgi:hypothetical protein
MIIMAIIYSVLRKIFVCLPIRSKSKCIIFYAFCSRLTPRKKRGFFWFSLNNEMAAAGGGSTPTLRFAFSLSHGKM